MSTGLARTPPGEVDAAAVAARLAESEARFRSLVLALNQVVWTTTPDGLVTEDSPSWRAFTGQSVEEFRGQGWLEALHPDDRPAAAAAWQAAVRERRIYEVEYRLRRPDGSYTPTLARGVPVLDVAGEVREWVGANVDISERKRLEAERQAQLDRAQAARAAAEEGLSRFWALLEDAPVAMAALRGPEHRFEVANPRYLSMVGRRPNIVGRTLREAFPELAPDEPVFAICDGVYRTGEPFTAPEYPVALDRRGDGTLEQAYFAFSIHPLRSEGRIDGLVITATEVTDQVRAREAVRESEARYRFLADAIPDAIWTATADGSIDYVNHRFLDYFGGTLEDRRGWGWKDAVHPDDVEACVARWLHSLTTGEPYEWEMRLRRASDGAYRWHMVRALPFRDAEGRIVRWFGSNTDISDRRQAEAEAKLARDRLNRIFEQAPVSIASYRGPDHVIESMNLAFRQMVGERELGRPVRQTFPEVDPGIFDLLDGVYATGEPYVGREVPVPLYRGGRLEDTIFTFTWQPITDVEGRVEGVTVFAVEVTDQVRARHKIRESEERFRTLVESTAQIVWWRDAAGDFVEEQPRWTAFTGQSFAEYRGSGWLAAIHPEDRERTAAAWRRTVSERGHYELEHRVRRADGEYRQMVVRAVPIVGEDGTVREWIGIHTDVTERERLIRALERSNQDLDQFAYVASHDLKAPLRGIANLSQWIEEDLGDKVSPEGREHLRLLHGRVHRMEALIEGILSYSRAGRVREKPEAVAIGPLLADLVELLNPPPTARIDIRGEMPQLVVEKVPLQQVFLNLVGNALKHARRSDPEVVIESHDEGAFVHFTIRDNGPGIPPEYHDRIWGIFQTLEARDKVEGAGIGLSVVKKIVETRGGRVWVESEPGSGATFHVVWPRRPQGGS